jgi:hypothetical protein
MNEIYGDNYILVQYYRFSIIKYFWNNLIVLTLCITEWMKDNDIRLC